MKVGLGALLTIDPTQHHSLEAAVLCIPHGYLQRLVTPVPERLRPVHVPPTDRRQKWLDLADVIAKRVPTEASRRTVNYLMALATEPSLKHPYGPYEKI